VKGYMRSSKPPRARRFYSRGPLPQRPFPRSNGGKKIEQGAQISTRRYVFIQMRLYDEEGAVFKNPGIS